MNKKLAEELRRTRETKGFSLREVEKVTKISNAYLSQLEHGNASNPSPKILHKLADFYNVPYESLMDAAGYLINEPKTNKKAGWRPSAKQAALMSEDLNDAEYKLLIQYIDFLRSQRKK